MLAQQRRWQPVFNRRGGQLERRARYVDRAGSRMGHGHPHIARTDLWVGEDLVNSLNRPTGNTSIPHVPQPELHFARAKNILQ